MHAHLADLLGKVDAGGVHGQADQGLVAVGWGWAEIKIYMKCVTAVKTKKLNV